MSVRPDPVGETAAGPNWSEADRLEALERYAILDTPLEPLFDDIVAIAAEVCDAPVAVVNFVAEGRQWFKAETGIGARELPLEVSICRHAILQPDDPDTLGAAHADLNHPELPCRSRRVANALR